MNRSKLFKCICGHPHKHHGAKYIHNDGACYGTTRWNKKQGIFVHKDCECIKYDPKYTNAIHDAWIQGIYEDPQQHD